MKLNLLARRLRLRAELFYFRLTKKPIVHFIHIGKTGGSAIKAALRNQRITPQCAIILHRHRTRLKHIPPGEKFFFFLRDPVAKFVSAFYSRKRQGMPKYRQPWSPEETRAFARFETPNALALALDSPDAETRQAAQDAMKSIHHINKSYWFWFKDEATLRSRRDDILLIGFQETLDQDFAALKRMLDLPDTILLPHDDVSAHRNKADVDKRLDEEAIRNLKTWYQKDYEFIELCKSLKAG
jgi:hypothetical protein